MNTLKGSYDVDHISWEAGGIVFTLVPDGPKASRSGPVLQFIWDSSALLAYHVTDETYRADCWGLDFEGDGRFYVREQSEYIDRFRQKSPLFPEQAIHFTIVGTNLIVDVLAKEYPMVKTL